MGVRMDGEVVTVVFGIQLSSVLFHYSTSCSSRIYRMRVNFGGFPAFHLHVSRIGYSYNAIIGRYSPTSRYRNAVSVRPRAETDPPI